MILFVAISSKSKGILYIIDFSLLFIGYFGLFLYKYISKDFIKKIYSYIFIVTGFVFWLTGILILIDNILPESTIKILHSKND